MRRSDSGCSSGKLWVVGIGPGSSELRTEASVKAIQSSEIIVGYKTYTALVKDLTINKEVDSSGMRDEKARVQRALDYVKAGKTVALISSGDPGVYGMAGLAFEICRSGSFGFIDIDVIPGITAANSGAALLGAPLSLDYCVLSLSDLLIPQEQILKRAEAAASGDYVTVLYNPVSIKRKKLILSVQDIFLNYNTPDTPVGITCHISREKESRQISTLSSFTKEVSHMVSTVVIGNSQTYEWSGKMVTPRGYLL